MISAVPAAAALAAMIRRHRLDAGRTDRLARLQLALAHQAPGVRVRLNRNRRTMLSLRGRPAAWTVSLHVGLLDHDLVVVEIPGWVRGQGRTTTPALRRCLHEVWQCEHAATATRSGDDALAQGLPALGGALDLAQEFAAVHQRWFAQLPPPAVGWARASPGRRLLHIRFGSYRRQPQPLVLINPRLDQPWIARAFVEHVLHHELCHHAMACQATRRERVHGPRFRTLERGFPLLVEVLAWERVNLGRLLGPLP